MTGLNDSISVAQGIRQHPSGAHKMLCIVTLAEIADLYPRNGCVNEPVIIKINTHMCNGMALAQGVEKHQITLF